MLKIIVPVDFSDCSLNAIRYAIALAKSMNAQILIVYAHTNEIQVNAIPAWLPYLTTMPLPGNIHEEMASLKNNLNDAGISANTFIMNGKLDDIIIELAQKKHADLVVMGTEGNSFEYATLWGTNTTDLIDRQKIPVLVVPKNYKGAIEPNIDCVFATDFEGLDAIPTFVVSLLHNLNATLHVFYDIDPYRDKELKALEELKLTHLKGIFTEIPVTMSHSYKENIVHAANDFVSKKQGSLIMMIAHKRNFLEGLFHTSVTKQMALHTQVPFLALPDAD